MHSDTGPHFRSNRTLAHAAIWLPQQFGIHCSHIYGMECHGKSDLDGMMGQVQQAKEFIGSELHINSLDALTIALTTEYELRAECKQIPMVNFVNWMPSIHFDKFKTSLLKTASLPCGIKACHSWMFTICDNRQKSMVGKNGEITGTWCRATVLPGIKATPNPKKHLFENDDAKAPEEDPDHGIEKEEEDAEDTDMLDKAKAIGVEVKEYMGWRCSYKRSSPEEFHKEESKVRRILQRKRKAMEPVMEHLSSAAKRHTPINQDRSKEQAREQDQRKFFKAKRLADKLAKIHAKKPAEIEAS